MCVADVHRVSMTMLRAESYKLRVQKDRRHSRTSSRLVQFWPQVNHVAFAGPSADASVLDRPGGSVTCEQHSKKQVPTYAGCIIAAVAADAIALAVAMGVIQAKQAQWKKHHAIDACRGIPALVERESSPSEWHAV